MSAVFTTRVDGYEQEQPVHMMVDVAQNSTLVYDIFLQSLVKEGDDPVQLMIVSQHPCSWQISTSLNIEQSIVQFFRNYLTSTLPVLKLTMLLVDSPVLGVGCASVLGVLLHFYSDVGPIKFPEHITHGPVWLLPAIFMLYWATVVVLDVIPTVFTGICYWILPCSRRSTTGKSHFLKGFIVLALLLLSVVLPAFTCPAVCRFVLYATALCLSALGGLQQPRRLGVLFFIGCTALLHGPELVFWIKACMHSGHLVVLHDNVEWLKAAIVSLLVHLGVFLHYLPSTGSADSDNGGDGASLAQLYLVKFCLLALS
ncbi:uncharacterized protein LOC135821924 [Sycon ciliatum]|uniref:uncharacterized protein LOC135821924 n=1 Tax=Sycon ciliatum TaxID=27933 RepID=UPI0031F6FEC9